MSKSNSKKSSLHWKWVIIAAIAGILIVGSSYLVVAPAFPSGDVQALVMLVGFIVTGAVTGYFSPGVTIREAGVGGAIVALLTLIALIVTRAEVRFSMAVNVLLLLVGIAFSWVGAWMGEKLQGSLSDEEDEGKENAFEWKWVLAGVILGFALNVLFVFIPAQIFRINIGLELLSYLVSFIVTGFVVGYRSKNVTILEPAIAGILAVILDWVFVKFLVGFGVEGGTLATGLALGFLFTLFGAWLGEKIQERTKAPVSKA